MDFPLDNERWVYIVGIALIVIHLKKEEMKDPDWSSHASHLFH